ncbi:MAG TPA: GxxExxY protein [Bellilinea sp.]|nr:GxxExxY protein [Bellilinea sp.]
MEKPGIRQINLGINGITRNIIGAAIAVHRELGAGLLESVYEECMAYELTQRGMQFERQKPIPVIYRGVPFECGFRVDFLVASQVVVELKAVERVLPVHMAQTLTYLKLTGCKLGLILNFNVEQMVKGVKRVALKL